MGSSFPPRPRELAVRLGCGPCHEEQAFLSRRKQVVAKALKQALQLDEDLQEDEVWGLGCRGWVSWVCWGPELSVESWNWWFSNQTRAGARARLLSTCSCFAALSLDDVRSSITSSVEHYEKHLELASCPAGRAFLLIVSGPGYKAEPGLTNQ